MAIVVRSGIAALATLLAGCASSPDEILPRPGSDVSAFRTMSCSDRSVAAADLHQRLSALETRQRRTRTLDTVGVGLFLIPVGSLMGGNHEAEIGDLKWRAYELDRSIDRDQCDAPGGNAAPAAAN